MLCWNFSFNLLVGFEKMSSKKSPNKPLKSQKSKWRITFYGFTVKLWIGRLIFKFPILCKCFTSLCFTETELWILLKCVVDWQFVTRNQSTFLITKSCDCQTGLMPNMSQTTHCAVIYTNAAHVDLPLGCLKTYSLNSYLMLVCM